MKRCGEQKAHVFSSFSIGSIEDKNRPKGWCRIFAISDVGHLRASCETQQLLAGQQVEPPLIQVHIDHGGAVLKWAEGINDKVGPIEAVAVLGRQQTPTWNLSLVSFLPRNGLDMIYWLRMYGVPSNCWCYMHVIRKIVDISSIFCIYTYIDVHGFDDA